MGTPLIVYGADQIEIAFKTLKLLTLTPVIKKNFNTSTKVDHIPNSN